MTINSALLNELDELIAKQDLFNRKKIKHSYYCEFIKIFTMKHNVHRATVFSLIKRRKNGQLKRRLPHNSLLYQMEEYLNSKGIK